jgi:large subunit ribosomal protein L7/L12
VSTQQNIDTLVETLSQLSVLDMAKLKSALEDKWGVKAAAAPAAESTEFKVTLEPSTDDKKISIIKVVREITSLGLKEAKELVEGAPKVLKETCGKAEAEEISKKVATAGGKVTLVGL